MPLQSPPEPALISQCELVLYEVDTRKIQEIMTHLIFGKFEEGWGVGGSPFQRWYRAATSLSINGAGRIIAWKSNRPFKPGNLFFRTIDSGRLLPMEHALFRLQIYAHKSHWEHLDKKDQRENWRVWMLSNIMHETLLMRNMHDTGGADIPIIITNWDENGISRAMEYWSELSKGEWTDSERSHKFSECANNRCMRSLPCFPQADLLVRSLLSDPAVGYVPPFIIIVPHQGSSGSPRVRALFTHPSHAPPSELTQSWPKSCGTPTCPDTDCGSFDFDACRSLSADSKLVRKSPWPRKRVACNLWGCEVLHQPAEESNLMRCQRCKEVLYCTSTHQSLDWPQHKGVCEPHSVVA